MRSVNNSIYAMCNEVPKVSAIIGSRCRFRYNSVCFHSEEEVMNFLRSYPFQIVSTYTNLQGRVRQTDLVQTISFEFLLSP